jgi:hypothetical protein
MLRLFQVEEVFEVRGRGVVLVPSTDSGLNTSIKPGDKISLRTPDGQVLESRISSIEFLHGIDTAGKKFCRMAVMLPPDIAKERIGKGTEVWSKEVNE